MISPFKIYYLKYFWRVSKRERALCSSKLSVELVGRLVDGMFGAHFVPYMKSDYIFAPFRECLGWLKILFPVKPRDRVEGFGLEDSKPVACTSTYHQRDFIYTTPSFHDTCKKLWSVITPDILSIIKKFKLSF